MSKTGGLSTIIISPRTSEIVQCRGTVGALVLIKPIVLNSMFINSSLSPALIDGGGGAFGGEGPSLEGKLKLLFGVGELFLKTSAHQYGLHKKT